MTFRFETQNTQEFMHLETISGKRSPHFLSANNTLSKCIFKITPIQLEFFRGALNLVSFPIFIIFETKNTPEFFTCANDFRKTKPTLLECK